MTSKTLADAISCLDDYDPEALRVDRACQIINECVEPVSGIEKVALRAALGRVLAEDVVSTVDVPGRDNSAMDGYALRFADLHPAAESYLRVVGTAFAGRQYDGKLAAEECVRIMTGAVMPPGADTVVIQEVVKVDGDRIAVPAGQQLGQNRRLAGEDLKRGHPALLRGVLVRPAELGLLASLGMVEVAVHRRLRVAFFSTGDELVSTGAALDAGQVYDSNRYTLYGMLTRLGCDVLDMGVVRDDPQSLEAALSSAAQNADVVITSGGVSVGEADFIRELLARLGDVVFWKIAMRPGRPMAFGRIGNTHFFGLPGNPVAVMVTFYQFVRGALLSMMGRRGESALPLLRVPCLNQLRKRPGRTEYQRGALVQDKDGIWAVRVTSAQGSGILRSMSEANCFVVLHHDQGAVNPGDLVSVQLMDGLV
jgi:molybdopterin molybdotransferase